MLKLLFGAAVGAILCAATPALAEVQDRPATNREVRQDRRTDEAEVRRDYRRERREEAQRPRTERRTTREVQPNRQYRVEPND